MRHAHTRTHSLLEKLAAVHKLESDAEAAREARDLAKRMPTLTRAQVASVVARRRSSVRAQAPLDLAAGEVLEADGRRPSFVEALRRRSSVGIAASAATPVPAAAAAAAAAARAGSPRDVTGGTPPKAGMPAPPAERDDDAAVAKLVHLPMPGDAGPVSEAAVLDDVLSPALHGMKLGVSETIAAAIGGEVKPRRRRSVVTHEDLRRQVLAAVEDIPERPKKPAKEARAPVAEPPPVAAAPEAMALPELPPAPPAVEEDPASAGVSPEDVAKLRYVYAAGDGSSLLENMRRAAGNATAEALAVNVSAGKSKCDCSCSDGAFVPRRLRSSRRYLACSLRSAKATPQRRHAGQQKRSGSALRTAVSSRMKKRAR